jgi:glutaredoxin
MGFNLKGGLMHFVKMYSANWCPDCRAMVSFLDKHDVAYQVINVDKNEQAVENLKNLCGGKKIVPTLEVEGKVFINPSIDDMGKFLLIT